MAVTMKEYMCIIVNLYLAVLVNSGVIDSDKNGSFNMTIRMPNVVSRKPDSLLCVSQKVGPEESYIVGFTPHVSKSTAHHLMVYGCNDIKTVGEARSCSSEDVNDLSVCKEGEATILFAWALDAEDFILPKGVGIRVGGSTGINYVMLNLHYAKTFKEGQTDNSGITLHLTHERQPMQAGYYVFASYGFIAPLKKEVHVETSCQFDLGYTIYPFGYRTHSHNLGVVTSGYRIRHKNWTEIGRMSPMLPQTFYPVTNQGMNITSGDIVAARCTMNSLSRTTMTQFGPANRDEMCNFYIIYSTYHKDDLITNYCLGSHDFKWSEELKEFKPFPGNASSLDGIPKRDYIRDHFEEISKQA